MSTETTFESNTYTDPFEHTGLCPSDSKTIEEIVTIDDGTGKLFTYHKTKNLEWKEYTIQPDFTVNPEEPTILDNAEIVPNISDPYDVVQTDGVDYDFAEDGTSLNHQESETVNQILSTPRLQTVIQTVRYFTGWETKSSSIQKDITKTNIAPEACNQEDMSCFTVPTAVYTSCSTDQEDNPQNLTINWKLYLDTLSTIEVSEDDQGNEIRTVKFDEDNQNFELQTSKDDNPVFSWTYNNEGRYKLIETAIDTDGAQNDAQRDFDIVFKKCSGDVPAEEQTIQASGVIEVEKNTWQLCAIPMVNGYWDSAKHKIISKKDDPVKSTIKNVLVDQIQDVYGVQAKEYFEVINTAVGDLGGQMYNYIPGFTKDTSIHNFPLVFTDEDNDLGDGLTKFEICGFWIKAKDRDFKIKWGVIEE